MKYFRIKRTDEIIDETHHNTILDIYTMSGEDIVVNEGELLTTAALRDLITEGETDGTFLVDTKEVKIKGLDTAAYTPTETYAPMDASI